MVKINTSCENGLYPRIRFPEFSDPIQGVSLSVFLEENTIRNRKLIFSKSDVLSVSGEYGVVNQISFQGRSFAGKSVAEYHVVYTGDIVYTKSPLKNNPYGIIKTNKGAPGIVSTLYAVYHPLNNVMPEFVEYYFADDLRLNKFLKPLVNIGAKHDMKINNQFVLTGKVWFPSKNEQTKIDAFLSLIQKRIEKQQEYIDALEKYKRGVMQMLFSRKARFKADDGSEFPEWEETKLGDEGYFYGGLNGKNKNDFGHGNGEYITYRNVFSNTFAKPDILEKVDIILNEKQNIVKYGDVMFTQSSETFEELGLSSVWLYSPNPFLNSFCFGWRPNSIDRFVPEYLGYFFRSENVRRQIIYQGQGISRINLAASRMSNIILSIPCIAEQQKIAACLSGFDDVIDKAKKELNAYRELKKGLLQQMFV